MTITTRNKKYLLAILFLWVICVLAIFSCKKDETSVPLEKEKDPGIHEKVDRGPATVFLDIDRKEISIAEHLNLTISVIVDENYEIKLPGFGERLEQFGIVDYHTRQPELIDDNRKKLSRSYELEPFLSGDYTIPPMLVRFWKKDEQETDAHKIETSEVEITVKSILPEDLKEYKLNDIIPPVNFPRSYLIWIWAGIAGAVICIVIIAVIIIKKRKKAKIENSVEKLPAHDQAYEELRILVEEDLINKGEIKLFYQRISGILRRYIENRFGLHAPEQTTEEFFAGMETRKDFPEQHKSQLKTFLNLSDLVKFAEYQPEMDTVQKTFDSCKAFIEETKDMGSGCETARS